MKSEDIIHIAVAETSAIVRGGLAAILRRLGDLNVQPVEISSEEGLRHCMEAHQPDILSVNPQFGGWFNLGSFKEKYPHADMKYVSLIYTVVDSSQLKEYDESVDLFDDVDSLTRKISVLMNVTDDEEGDANSLSQREKEIVGCVVRGMTNKEIAEKLFISVHTVITHRRNITRKLQIHSAAGLTIYAIVNKLVELGEVKMNL